MNFFKGFQILKFFLFCFGGGGGGGSFFFCGGDGG